MQPGTYAYMAPEQFGTYKGVTGLEGFFDVYSLGVMLYLMLAGRLPLYSPEPLTMMGMACFAEPDRLGQMDPTLPKTVVELVHAMLAKKPQERPTMAQVKERLAALAGVGTLKPDAFRARPTGEHDMTLAQPSTSGHEAALAKTGDMPADPAVKSIGERSTRPSSMSDAEAVLSSSRGIGEQLTGTETKTRRRRQLRWVAVGAALLLCLPGLAVWRSLRRKPIPVAAHPTPLAQPVKPTTPPADIAAQPAPEAKPQAPVAPVELSTPVKRPPPETVMAATSEPKIRRGKPKALCTPVELTTGCIQGPLSDAQKVKTVSALREALNTNPKAPLKFCDSYSLAIAGDYEMQSSKGLGKETQDNFAKALRAFLRLPKLPGEIEIKCHGK
jgi:serine/threonine-protein kinase